MRQPFTCAMGIRLTLVRELRRCLGLLLCTLCIGRIGFSCAVVGTWLWLPGGRRWLRGDGLARLRRRWDLRAARHREFLIRAARLGLAKRTLRLIQLRSFD